MAEMTAAHVNLSRNSTTGEDPDDDTAGIVVAKAVAMVVLSAATFLLGFVPIVLSRVFKWNQVGAPNSNRSRVVLSVLLSFGGGALLCTTFMHLLPEVTESVDALQASGDIGETEFQLSALIMCGGFFMMYLIEELVHMYLHWREKEGKEEDVLHRSFSLRRCSTATNGEAKRGGGECVNEGYEHDEEDGHAGHSHEGEPRASKKENGSSHDHHGHSHVIIAPAGGEDVVSPLRGLLIVIALSVHELFEGLAVGLEDTTGGVYYMFGAVASHKLVLAFCVGLELVSARTKMALNVVYLLTFALVSPIGIGIGIALSDTATSGNGVLNVVLQGVATGTLLYVVFFEVLTRERANTKTNGLVQLLAILVGFGVMFGLLMAGELSTLSSSGMFGFVRARSGMSGLLAILVGFGVMFGLLMAGELSTLSSSGTLGFVRARSGMSGLLAILVGFGVMFGILYDVTLGHVRAAV